MEQAKTILKRSKSAAKDLHIKAGKTHLGSEWSGNLFDSVELKKKATESDSHMLITRHENAIGEVDKQIWYLRFQIDYIAKAINDIEASISVLTAKRDHAAAEGGGSGARSGSRALAR